MNTVIVYGPQACGKTTNADALMKHFGCDSVIDDWTTAEALNPGAIHLTNDERLDGISAFERRVAGSKREMEAPVYSFAAAMRRIEIAAAAKPADIGKATNPKDGVGVKKWRQFCTVPQTVVAEVGVAMLEGHLKGYRRHNFRVAGVRSSVYVDAAMGHIAQWWEGEDFDPDVPGKRMSHITKAIASLVVLRDAMIQDMLNDDRPPKGNLEAVRSDMQATVDALFERYPNGVQPFTELNKDDGLVIDATKLSLSAADFVKLGAGGILQPGTR